MVFWLVGGVDGDVRLLVDDADAWWLGSAITDDAHLVIVYGSICVVIIMCNCYL